MPVIRVVNFGGEVPSASARALPDTAAQEASDIMPGTVEFRPTLGDGTTETPLTVVTNPKTMYRYHQVGGSWYTSAEELNIVRGQVEDDTTERTYVSRQDGSAAPQIFPSGLPLGVPAPTLAATLALNDIEQFTEDRRAAAIIAAGLEARDGLHNNMSLAVKGSSELDAAVGFAPDMAMTVPGYFVRSIDPYAGSAAVQMGRAFRATSTGGSFDGGFETAYVDASVDTPANFAWALDPQLQGYWQSMPSVGIEASPWGTTWGTATGDDHWIVPFNAFTRAIVLDRATAETALEAILLPGGNGSTDKFYTPDEVTAILDTVEAYLDPDGANIKPKFDDMGSKVVAMKGWMDGGALAFSAPTLTAYYASIETDTDAAITAFANAIADLAISVANARTVTTGNEGGGP